MRLPFRCAVLVGLVLAVSACAQGRDTRASTPRAQFQQYVSDKEHAEGVAAQGTLLADGVSAQEYETAVAWLESCLKQSGVTLVNHGWNPVNYQRMNLWYVNAAMPDDEVAARGDQCHAAHLARIEQRYALEHAPRMSSALLAESRSCLSGRGMTTSGAGTSLADLVRTAGLSEERTVLKCVLRGVEKLYPGVPVTIS
ncbi:hypothetical protein ACM01_05085 [Streptomyces viridochromogenes]|uniref:Lipoprotein n=1 Tax=Streptomyces viridochromogenes TaxID=1938 RepID=A0A0J7ZN83_STRVR|nr:hypothetical protein [Streptomyces viridochromogenes]KMS76553.1 hypothetical protein ACM01_05085 [Streptomyces viridochromogenes]KOG23331.1 hypothetical protein ADK35_13745 [Streptomyces viridochromogenes]KOG27063.1 hypothetical protein ADK36_00320 [Streptomyces viridochromogenes]